MVRTERSLRVSKAAVASFVLATWVALDCWLGLSYSYSSITIAWNLRRLCGALCGSMGWRWSGIVLQVLIMLIFWFVLPPVAIGLGIKGYRECKTRQLRGRTWAVLAIVVATLDLSLKVFFLRPLFSS
jgi:hypothetical protein